MLEGTPYSTTELLGGVRSMHSTTRYGHSKDISQYFSSTASERNDYLRGIILVFSILMIVAVLWFVVLLILKCLGKRVGCASGRPTSIPAETLKSGNDKFNDSPYDDVESEESGEFIVMQSDQNRINRSRLVYFFSGVFAIAASGFVLFGVTGVQGNLKKLYKNAVELDTLVSNSPTSVAALTEAAITFDKNKNELMIELSTFCPPPSATVQGLNASETTSSYLTALGTLGDISTHSNYTGFADSIDEVADITDNLVDMLSFASKSTAPWFITSLSFVCLVVLLIIFFLICAWKSGNAGFEFVGEMETSCKTRIRVWVITPLFCLLIILLWVTSSALFSSAVISADFCYEEITTGLGALRILEASGYDSSSELYMMTDEYLHNCESSSSIPLDYITSYETDLATAKDAGVAFETLSDEGDVTDLDSACSGDASAAMILAQTTSESMTNLETALDSAKNDLSCGQVAPLVQKSVYKTACSSVFSDILWTFISVSGLAFFVTIMLTLRSAIIRPQIYIVPANNNDIGPIPSYPSNDGQARTAISAQSTASSARPRSSLGGGTRQSKRSRLSGSDASTFY